MPPSRQKLLGLGEGREASGRAEDGLQQGGGGVWRRALLSFSPDLCPKPGCVRLPLRVWAPPPLFRLLWPRPSLSHSQLPRTTCRSLQMPGASLCPLPLLSSLLLSISAFDGFSGSVSWIYFFLVCYIHSYFPSLSLSFSLPLSPHTRTHTLHTLTLSNLLPPSHRGAFPPLLGPFTSAQGPSQ